MSFNLGQTIMGNNRFVCPGPDILIWFKMELSNQAGRELK
jgi:hypothetical protein